MLVPLTVANVPLTELALGMSKVSGRAGTKPLINARFRMPFKLGQPLLCSCESPWAAENRPYCRSLKAFVQKLHTFAQPRRSSVRQAKAGNKTADQLAPWWWVFSSQALSHRSSGELRMVSDR